MGENDAIKKIQIFPAGEETDNIPYEKESYEYGRGIDEGIVSYIENMTHVKEWQNFEETGSYDCNRRIVNQLGALYEKIPHKEGLNVIEQYVVDPKNTLKRITFILPPQHFKGQLILYLWIIIKRKILN